MNVHVCACVCMYACGSSSQRLRREKPNRKRDEHLKRVKGLKIGKPGNKRHQTRKNSPQKKRGTCPQAEIHPGQSSGEQNQGRGRSENVFPPDHKASAKSAKQPEEGGIPTRNTPTLCA